MASSYENIGTAQDLSDAIKQIDTASQAGTGTGAVYTITLAAGATLAETSDLSAINLKGTDQLVIHGSGATLDGGAIRTTTGGATTITGGHRGFFVYAGTVSIDDLVIRNAIAVGGNGGSAGGGGGAGLGGALFIAGRDNVDGSGGHLATGGRVTLNNVSMLDNTAKGGSGGSFNGGTAGGGGGRGGNGGSPPGYSWGGGGGVGTSAVGGLDTSSAGAGIVIGAASGGTGARAGGINGGGGGGGDGNRAPQASGGGVGGAAPVGQDGGMGGFGGGGGAGSTILGNKGAGGAGGFGGGGGFGSAGGGGGGFGGGGGGSGGIGGFGAGSGYTQDGGGGGLGAGGDIFIQAGASLTIVGGSLAGGLVRGGSAGQIGGSALGAGIFLQGDQGVTLAAVTGDTNVVADVIADQTGSGGTGADAGAGRLVVGTSGNAGTVLLSAANTYTGGTTLNAGTLDLAGATMLNNAGTVTSAAAGTGTITFGSTSATLQIESAALTGTATARKFNNTVAGFAIGDTMDLRGIGTAMASFDYSNDLLTLTGTTTTTVQLTGSYAGKAFVAMSDNNGGTAVMLGTAAAPTIAGTHTTADMAEAAVMPFSGVTVGDTNAGATETLTIALSGAGGTLTGAGTAAANGTYTLTGTAQAVTSQLQALSFTPANATPGATVSTTFTLTDASSAGTSASNSGTMVTDTSRPSTLAAPRLAASSDTGVSNGDDLTNATAPVFTGSAPAGATVTIYDGGTAIGSGVATGGNYGIATSGLRQGVNAITATQTVNGVTSAMSAATAVTLDTTVPTITVIADSGDGIAADGSGDLGAGKIVTITVAMSEPVYVTGGTPTATLNDGGTATYTGGSGTSTLTFSYTVAAGQNTAALTVTGAMGNSATVTDAAGNPIDVASLRMATVPSGTLVIDTTAPSASSPTLTAAQNGGPTSIGITAPSDNLTAAGSLAIVAGTLPSDGTVTLADGVTPVATGQSLTAPQLQSLLFTPTPGAFGQGSTFTYTVTDAAGNASQGTAALNVGGPGAPIITGTHASSTTSEAPVSPFTGVTVADPSAAMDTLTIALTGSGGMLTDGAGYSGLMQNADGSYQLTGSTAAITQELDALIFTPTAGAAGTTSITTFVLTDASSSGTSVTDTGTNVADTDPAAAPTPVTGPATANAPGVAPADTVSIVPSMTYKHGVFTLTGTASSAVGVAGVEISAVLNDGTRQDLGAATVNADGTFSFADRIGRNQQSFIEATLTDGVGLQTTSTDAAFSLRGGLHQGPFRAQQFAYTADGMAVTSTSLFLADGSRRVEVQASGQTLTSNFFDTFDNGGAPDNTFVFDPGHGLDIIRAFRVDNTDHDTLSFKGSDFGNSIAEVLRNTTNGPGGVTIADPTSGDTVKLMGITKAELKAHPKDFAFHG